MSVDNERPGPPEAMTGTPEPVDQAPEESIDEAARQEERESLEAGEQAERAEENPDANLQNDLDTVPDAVPAEAEGAGEAVKEEEKSWQERMDELKANLEKDLGKPLEEAGYWELFQAGMKGGGLKGGGFMTGVGLVMMKAFGLLSKKVEEMDSGDAIGLSSTVTPSVQSGSPSQLEQVSGEERVENEKALAENLEGWKPSHGVFYFEDTDSPSNHSSQAHEALVVTSEQGQRVHPITKEVKAHNGIDVDGFDGQEIYSKAPAIVKKVSFDQYNGYRVALVLPDGAIAHFSHLRSMPTHLKLGQLLKPGELIGRVGATGLATGSHLHFQVYDKSGAVTKARNYYNPSHESVVS